MTYFKPVYYFECCFGMLTNIAIQLGLVKVQQWVGVINEFMNVNSRMVPQFLAQLPKKLPMKSLVWQQNRH